MKISRPRALPLALAALVLAPAWLLASESGLRLGLYCAERLTGGMFTVREAQGRLIGDVRLMGLELRTPAAAVHIEQADLNLRLTRLLIGRVQAESLTARTVVVTVHDRSPVAERKPLTVFAPLRLAVEEGHLSNFRLHLARAQRDWALPEAQFAGHWRGRWMVIATLKGRTAEAGPVELRGRMAIADDLLQFEDFEITRPSPVKVEGALALTDAADSALQLSWENLRWPRAEVLPWLHSPKGVLKIEGPWRRYAWTLGARAVAADIPGDIVARGHGDTRSLAIEDTRVQALEGAASAKGRVEWAGAVRTDLELRWQDLNPAARLSGWPGRLNGSATLQARWDQRKPHVEFDGRFTDSQLRGYPFALQARGRTEENAVHLQEFAAQSGVSQLRAAGQLWPQLGLKGDLRSTDLGSLWAGLSGQGEAQFSVAGAPDTLRFGVRAAARAPGFRGVRARTLALDADVGFKGPSQLTLKLEDLHAGMDLGDLTLAGAGTREAHRATLSLTGAEGAALLGFAGGERKGVWSGQLREVTVTPAQGAAWQLEEPAALTARLVGLRLEPACLRGVNSRACLDLDLTAVQQRIAFRIHQFDLRHLRPWLPPSWTMTGSLSGTTALQVRNGELAALNADLAGSAGTIQGDGVRLDYGPGLLSVQPEDGRLAAVLKLTPAGGTIDGQVHISAGGALLDRPMLGDLRVNLPDLAWLPVLSPEIAAAQGSIEADLNVSGTMRSPALDGRLQVANARVRLATPGIELTDITASFERGRDAPLNVRLSAKSGEGQFTFDGVLKTMQPKLVGTFNLKGDQVLGFNTPELRAWITPDLTLALDGTHARLTGEVAVPRAEITPRELRGGGVGPSSDQVVVSHEDTRQGSVLAIESEVRVVLGDKVRFDGLGLKTRLEGAITAYDQADRPTTGRGELRLVGGRYKAYGQDLQIETGRLLFSGGPITDPAIDLSAFRKPLEDIKVGLRARGSLAAPEFSLYSEPAMSQEEQLSWLVLGRSLSATLSSNQGNELSGAAASLGLTGGELLAQRLAPRLGFDEVSLGAKPGETTDLARLTIGKYLSPKLFVSYGVGLFQPGHFFRLQYSLGKRFKLVGESGLQQGGDVLYSVESGK